MAAVEQASYARELLPAIAYVWSHTGVPERVLLAMSAVATDWGRRGAEGLASPWVPPGGMPGPASGPFPSLAEAARALVETLAPRPGSRFAAAWAARADPRAYLAALEAAGWGTPGWAEAAAAELEPAAAALAVVEAGLPPATAAGAAPPPLTPAEGARVALAAFPPEAAATALAIAMVESGLDPLAVGGSHADHPEADLVRQLSAAAPRSGRALPAAGAPPYTRFGLWQIEAPLHARALVRLTRSGDPAVWAAWLFVPDNNAALAREIFDGRQKFAAWRTFVEGTHRARLGEATRAVAAAAAG